MISTAVPESDLIQDLAPSLRLVIVIDTLCTAQRDLALTIKARLDPSAQERSLIISLQEAASLSESLSGNFVVYLLELEMPFLFNIHEEGYTQLQKSLSYASHILWITPAGGDKYPEPGYGMFEGLARVLRSEDSQLLCVSLALDSGSLTSCKASNDRHATIILSVLQETATQHPEDIESEYVDRGGLLYINRMIPMKHLNHTIQSYDHPQQVKQAFSAGPPLALTFTNPGMLDSIQFIEDDLQTMPLAPEEVEIEVKAAGVNFMDCLVVLGRVNKSTMGGECAGVVTRVGSAYESLQPGDRVCAAILDCFKTFARSDSMLVAKIPEHVSTLEASSIPVTAVTAHYALVEFARLQKGESVLIHSAAGGTGQHAIQIAQKIGAVVYVTVGTPEKRRLLVEKYNIPNSHILCSRNTSFAQGLMRLTGNKGVDVILNSLSGELLTASWDCIASFGRFVEIGKKDIHSHSDLPMYPFRKNVSFGAVDLDHMYVERRTLFRKSLVAVVDMLAERELHVASPLHTYPVSNIESALRSMQSGKHMGKILIDFQKEAPVQVFHAL